MNNKRNDLVNVPRLQKFMDDQELDALVATTMGNVYYLTGIMGEGLQGHPYDHQTYAVITRDEPLEPYFITTQGLTNQALDAFGGLKGVVAYGRFFRPGPFLDVKLTDEEEWLRRVAVEEKAHTSALDALIYVLGKMKLDNKKIGLDEINLTEGYFKALAEKLPEAKFVKASETMRQIRKVKTAAEVERLRKVAHINETAIMSMVAIAKDGITEEELAREYMRSVSGQGAFPRFICVRAGRNGVMAERIPSRTQLKAGEPLFIDVGV